MLLSQRILLALWLGSGFAQHAGAEDARQKLETVQHGLDDARRAHDDYAKRDRDLAAELDRLRMQSVQLARAAQDNEAKLSELETNFSMLNADLARQRAGLAQRRARQARVLGALEQLASAPPAAMVFAPGTPLDLARGGMLLGSAVPALQAEVNSLAEATVRLAATQDQANAGYTQITEREHALQDDREKLASLVGQRQALEGETRQKAEAAQKRVAALTAEAADLTQIIEKLDRDRRAQEDAARAESPAATAPAVPLDPSSAEQGRMTLPVAGQLIKRFGQAEETGTSKGVTFVTRPHAEIVAPADGEIMFAGPFKGYGQILIIDHAGLYHSLLAGIDQIGVAVGQKVVSGEPVGTMSAKGQTNLYLELRRQGQAIDPMPWLMAHNGKVSG